MYFNYISPLRVVNTKWGRHQFYIANNAGAYTKKIGVVDYCNHVETQNITMTCEVFHNYEEAKLYIQARTKHYLSDMNNYEVKHMNEGAAWLDEVI